MTFGVLMLHIAGSQTYRFAQIGGVAMPLAVPEKIEPARMEQVTREEKSSGPACVIVVSKRPQQCGVCGGRLL